MSEVLHKITGKLFCRQQASAFLIDEKIAITTRHAIKDNLINGTEIKLEFYSLEDIGYTKEVYAEIKAENEKFDVAILELNEPVYLNEDFPLLNSKKLDSNDVWECVGFPISWESASDGSRFCYIKGDIYYNASYDKTTKYDLHLGGKHINPGWESLEGLSGSPILVGNEIRAIVVAEEFSIINSPIKSISINRIATFLESNGIKINTAFGAKTNHINNRLALHKKNSEELFNKVEYIGKNSDMNLLINSYHVKYNDNGKPKTKQLVEHLVASISDYAFNLIDSEEMNTGLMKPHVITKKMNEAILHIESEGRLGSILIWMLIEGIFGAPKGLKRISFDNENRNFNDLHIGISTDGKLILYIGEGTLDSDLKTAIIESVKAIMFCIDIKNDVLLIDEYFYNQIESENLKKLLLEFNKTDKNWDNVILEMTILTGYDSKFINSIEQGNYSKEVIDKIISQKYIEECATNEEFICSELSKEFSLKDIKINWFTLPFNTLEDFKTMFFDEIK